MMGVLRRNFGYKLVSVAIAVLLYFIANNQQNPHATNEVYVLPEVLNLPDDLVVRTAPGGYTVTVAGPASAVSTFKTEPIKATVDVSRAGLGFRKLPIQYKLPSGDIDVTGWPITAEVTLEKKARREWFVDVLFDNEPPPGYVYLEPDTTPRKVEVSGLASEVARVARVVAVAPKTQSAWEINESVDLVAQNEKQQVVDTVQIDPARVQVRLGLKRASIDKSLLLSIDRTGSPAPGFFVSNYTFSPPMVTVTGTQEVLSNRSSLSVPVSVEGITETQVKTVSVKLPPEIAFQNPKDAQVQIRIEVTPISALPPVKPTSPVPALPSSSETPVPHDSATESKKAGVP